MVPVVERISETANLILGEGPHWDIKSQSLYFVDILGKSVHKYVPSTGKHTKVILEKQCALVIPVKDRSDQFVVNQENEIVIATWNGLTEKPSKIVKLIDVESGSPNKLNDGKCDSLGRLWTGTIGNGLENCMSETDLRGAFYSFTKGKLTPHIQNVRISNGLAWNDQLKKFYYVDTLAGGIDEYDFDLNKGTLSNPKRIFKAKINSDDLSKSEALDGMTIDADGNLWVAVFGFSKIIKIDPKKPNVIQETVKFPADQITSLTWGGSNLDILFVTTANWNKVTKNPEDGVVYKVTGLGTKGLPANEFIL